MGLNEVIKKVQTRSEDISHGRYFINAIDEATKRMFVENKRKPSQYFTPSSLGNCIRQNYYKRTGAPIDDKIDQKVKNCKKANSGTDRHDRVQKVITKLEDFGFNIKWVDVKDWANNLGYDYLDISGKQGKEYKILDTRYDLNFRIDGLVRIKDKEYIFEFKTDDTYRWGRRKSISSWHTMQGYCYSLSLQIPFLLYVYEERNEFKLKYFDKKITDKQRQKVLDKINTVNDYVEKGELPTEKDLNSCKFCLYTEICDKNINVGDYKED